MEFFRVLIQYTTPLFNIIGIFTSVSNCIDFSFSRLSQYQSSNILNDGCGSDDNDSETNNSYLEPLKSV